MRLKRFPYLLIVLLLSASFDDTWAAATADTRDDVQSSEDDEYPPASRHTQAGRKRLEDLPSPAAPHSRPAGRSPADPSPRHPTATPPAPSGPPLLYVLMSLQR
jgi:hypothetical protein